MILITTAGKVGAEARGCSLSGKSLCGSWSATGKGRPRWRRQE
jgi:hypothetical protein